MVYVYECVAYVPASVLVTKNGCRSFIFIIIAGVAAINRLCCCLKPENTGQNFKVLAFKLNLIDKFGKNCQWRGMAPHTAISLQAITISVVGDRYGTALAVAAATTAAAPEIMAEVGPFGSVFVYDIK